MFKIHFVDLRFVSRTQYREETLFPRARIARLIDWKSLLDEHLMVKAWFNEDPCGYELMKDPRSSPLVSFSGVGSDTRLSQQDAYVCHFFFYFYFHPDARLGCRLPWGRTMTKDDQLPAGHSFNGPLATFVVVNPPPRRPRSSRLCRDKRRDLRKPEESPTDTFAVCCFVTEPPESLTGETAHSVRSRMSDCVPKAADWMVVVVIVQDRRHH